MRLEIEESFFTDAQEFFNDPLAERPALTQLTPVKLKDIEFELSINKFKMDGLIDTVLEQPQTSKVGGGFLLDSNSSIAYND